MSPQVSRRDALRLAASTFTISSVGCLSSNVGQSPSGTSTTSESPTPLAPETRTVYPNDTPNNIGAAPAPNCPDGYVANYDPWWEVIGSRPIDGFDLTLDQETYTTDERLVATLRNVTDKEKQSGHESKVDIQYHGSNGWHTIFGGEEGLASGFPAVGVVHPPNGGYTWEATLSKAKLAGDEGDIPGFLYPCQPIKPGQYRFVYWGVGARELALGVPFKVVHESD